ncbi:MAG: hypothetical protein ACHQIL_05915 [Steroidobacterales bacterium]
MAEFISDPLVALTLPVIRAELAALEHNLAISDLALHHSDDGDIVILTANLVHPVHIGNTLVEPLGWNGGPEGLYRVRLNAHSVLLAPVVLLIAVLSWPARSWREMRIRLTTALPLLCVLFALDAPLCLLGNFQHVVFDFAGLKPQIPMYRWAQFLGGGGSTAIALAFAAAAVSLAAKIDPKAPPLS